MARTRVPSEQLNFRSANTGTHLLDTYLEDAEKGGLTLSELLSKLFDDATGNIDTFTFTYDGTSGNEKMFLKIGTDGAVNEIASFTQLFADLNSFKSIAQHSAQTRPCVPSVAETYPRPKVGILDFLKADVSSHPRFK